MVVSTVVGASLFSLSVVVNSIEAFDSVCSSVYSDRVVRVVVEDVVVSPSVDKVAFSIDDSVVVIGSVEELTVTFSVVLFSVVSLSVVSLSVVVDKGKVVIVSVELVSTSVEVEVVFELNVLDKVVLDVSVVPSVVVVFD